MPNIGNFPERGCPKPLSIGPPNIVPQNDGIDWNIDGSELRKNVSLELGLYWVPVYLPDRAVVTKLTLYGYRDDVLSGLSIILRRASNVGVTDDMANVEATWTDGDGSGYDDTIDNAVIDNENYSYIIALSLTPNDSVNDVRFRRAQIDWI